jgi:hypothetical protein
VLIKLQNISLLLFIRNPIIKTAGLAPTGMEGLFFAVGSSRALLAPLGDLAMGMMNERYNPNCPGKTKLLFQRIIYGTDEADLHRQFQNAEIVMGISVISSLLVVRMVMLFTAHLYRRAAPHFSTIYSRRALPPVRNVLPGSQ